MKKVYVVDPTARQYVFDIKEEGLSIIVNGVTHVISGESNEIEIFNDAITNGYTFIIFGDNRTGSVVFNSKKITAVKIAEE
jgi:hypothetical protein